jgi:hemin uptake protein HemP
VNLDCKGRTQESYFIANGLGRVVSSATLLGQDKSIVIVHDGQRYVLRVTKLGKLILTK